MQKLRRVNKINEFIEDQIKYYEDHPDYRDNFLEFIGDTLQYDGVYNEDQINDLLNSDLTTDTDYSYMDDDAIAVYSIGEIELFVDTNLTHKEYEAIEDKLNYSSSFKNGELIVYICSGMNIRVYSDLNIDIPA